MRKNLPWCYTKYNQSLDCDVDLRFYKYLLETDIEAAKFYWDFHIDASTNNPTSTWGKKRRSGRRSDVYHNSTRESIDE